MKRSDPLLIAAVCGLMVANAALGATEEQKAPKTTGPLIVLEPYTVNEKPPPLCFGVSLSVWQNVKNGKIIALYITKVKKGSDALKAGLGARTRIHKIDRVPVEELTASFEHGGDLNRIFINRKLSEKITIEAQPEGSLTTKTVVLKERPNFNARVRWNDVNKPSY